MHTKNIGSIGEQAVILNLLKYDIPVFQSVGDNYKQDLIVLVDPYLVKVQVKTRFKTGPNGSYLLQKRSCGPGYTYYYTKEEVDIFALVAIKPSIKIAYIPFSCFENNISLRVSKAKNGQEKRTNLFKDYSSFYEAFWTEFELRE